MTKQIFIAALLAAAFSATPALARIGHGYTARSTHMFAGPQASYPQVRRLPFHTEVTIYGCLRDWSWCDVSHRTDRGWVLGSDIAIGTQGRLRPMSPELGLAVLPFIIGTYWDTYYRNRPFYSQRSDFYSQRPDRGQQYQGLRQPAWGGHPPAVSSPLVQHRNGTAQNHGVRPMRPATTERQPMPGSPLGHTPLAPPQQRRPATAPHDMPPHDMQRQGVPQPVRAGSPSVSHGPAHGNGQHGNGQHGNGQHGNQMPHAAPQHQNPPKI